MTTLYFVGITGRGGGKTCTVILYFVYTRSLSTEEKCVPGISRCFTLLCVLCRPIPGSERCNFIMSFVQDNFYTLLAKVVFHKGLVNIRLAIY